VVSMLASGTGGLVVSMLASGTGGLVVSMLASGTGGLVVSVLASGTGGLVVSVLASGTKVRRFKPGRRRWIFRGEHILSMPSFENEVKTTASQICRM
jgi:hypothetical protein